MEDALRAAFEAQFGTEWSAPVVASKESNSRDADESGDDSSGLDEFGGFSGASDDDTAVNVGSESLNEDGPITVKHDEAVASSGLTTQSKAQKRRFLNGGGAPKDDSVVPEAPKTKEESLDLQNDLELQRLIEESHILHERPKGQEYTGADISGAGDPMEMVGNNRVKLMQARLAKAGAKQSKQIMPQSVALKIRNRSAERATKHKQEAREAGIVLAREQHVRTKHRKRDTGLRINTIGRASEHGIHISAAERDRVRKQAQASRAHKRRR